MIRLPDLIASVGLLAIAAPAAAEDLCPRARTALGAASDVLICAPAPQGIAIASDRLRAEQLARLGEAGEARFQTHFGRDAGPYVILEAAEIAVGDPKSVLTAAGFNRVLVWFSQEDYVRQVVASVRMGAEETARRQGLDAEAIRSAGDRAVAARTPGRRALDAREAQVVPHELGHGWFIKAYWPGLANEPQGHYGSPAPDWLDETAALLMEDGDGAEERRTLFRDVYKRRGRGALAAYPTAALIDLPRFLSRDHPTRTAPDIRPTESVRPGAVSMRVINASDPAAMSGVIEAALYYPQARMFADFLIDRAGEPQVFDAIAQAIARGQTFEDWLKTEGEAHALPASIAALDALWQAWLTARFGAPAV